MDTVIWTALGVGAATVIGAGLGFIIKNPSHKVNDAILSFAAGVMLCAAVVGLILPSLPEENPDFWGVALPIVGIFVGAICLNLIDRLVPHLHKLTGADLESHPDRTGQLNKVLLFVIAIAIHNLPSHNQNIIISMIDMMMFYLYISL